MKIILSAALALLLLGCSDDATTQTAKKEISQQAHETAAVVAKSTDEVMQKAKEATSVVSEQVQKVTQKSVAKVKEVSTQVVQKSAKAVEKVAKDIQASTAPTKPALDGQKLFTACAGCHGAHGERKAMGKSQIIKGWQASKVADALHGYKNGTYGGAMKAIMKGQASKLDDAKIEAIAQYISKQ